MTRWSIGELARQSGLTIRTLYHYDEIGLVVASERTSAGHRRYVEADVQRLYRVRSLRQLGFSLDEIRTVLSTSDSLHSLLTAQLAYVDQQVTQLSRLRAQLEGLLWHEDAQSLLTTLEMMSVYESHFTSEQLGSLRERAAALGAENVEALKASWLELVGAIRQHMADGTPPSSPAVQELSRRWEELGSRFHGGDPGVLAAADSAWQENKSAISAQIGWPADDGLVDYVRRARERGSDDG